MKPALPCAEPLEARIAPTVFLLHTDLLDIPHDRGAQGTGAMGSVPMAIGDRLILDTNGDHRFGPGDQVLVAVTGGKALVFLTDRNGDSGWDADEITGLAVSDQFRATIYHDVAGSITTSLDARGAHTATLQFSKIATLTVKGRVEGKILAGGGVEKLRMGTAATGTEPVVQAILAGTASHEQAATLGTHEQTFSFVQPRGKAGASIRDIAITGWAGPIYAGDGFSADAGAVTPGGDISHVNIRGVDGSFKLSAGQGGTSDGNTDASSGGSISKVRVHFTGLLREGTIAAGNGGSAITGRGAEGGSVEDVTISALQLLGFLSCDGGNGGSSFLGSAGASHGGSVSEIRLRFGSGGPDSFVIMEGGEAGFGVRGAASGGDARRISMNVDDPFEGDFSVYSGSGSFTDCGLAGNGGKVTRITLRAPEAPGFITVSAARGGDSRGPVVPNFPSIGGNGGSHSRVSILVPGDLGNVFLTGGFGGRGEMQGGRGGNGCFFEIRAGDAVNITVTAGRGGEGGFVGGSGGHVFSGLLTVHRDTPVSISVEAGGGGSGDRTGGDGGSVSDLTIRGTVLRQTIYIRPGDGGRAPARGERGSVSDITLDIHPPA